MARVAIHPSVEILRALGAGKLKNDAVETVVNHLESCQECQTRLASLSGDSFLERLRAAHRLNAAPASTCSVSRADTVHPSSPAPSAPAEIPAELRTLTQYEAMRELGRGGMGVVYLAKNKDMDREEVLKVVNQDLLGEGGAERFLREIRAAAKLNHRNIVSAYATLHAGKLLILAMEYVPGDDLAKVVKAHGPLPVANACFYIQQAAQGLQHAHEKQMVHRDIKPGNLMLARDGKRHVVKILDFGLAKATHSERSDHDLTGDNKMLGTPAYMAPEQAMDAARADIRADIYSLGCSLYYLLAGRAPFEAASVIELAMAHLSAEAKPVHQLRADAPASLSAVIAKMMAKDPAQRYQTPLEVVTVLAPFVQGSVKPLLAQRATPALDSPRNSHAETKTPCNRPPTMPAASTPLVHLPAHLAAAGKSSTLKRRLIGSGIALVLLVLGLGMALVTGGVLMLRTKDGTIVFKNLPPDAVVIVDGDRVSVELKGDGKPMEVRAVPGKHTLEVHRDGFKVQAQELTLVAGGREPIEVNLIPLSPPIAKGTPPTGDQQGSAPPVTGKPQVATTNNLSPSEYYFTKGVVHFGPSGPRVVLRYNDKEHHFAQVIDMTTGLARSPKIQSDSHLYGAVFNPDGTRIIGGRADNTALIWDATTGKPLLPPLEHGDYVPFAAFSPDGTKVVTTSADKMVRIWDALKGRLVCDPIKISEAGCAAFSHDGRRIATGSAHGPARIWDTATGEALTPPMMHQYRLNHVQFSADGKRLVTTSDAGAYVWDAQTGQPVSPVLHPSKKRLTWSVFSPDGKRVATGPWDNMARIWDAATGEELGLGLNLNKEITGLAFSRDGKSLAVSGYLFARVWDASTGQPISPILQYGKAGPNGPTMPVFTPDGSGVIIFGTWNNAPYASLWDVATGQQVRKVTVSPE